MLIHFEYTVGIVSRAHTFSFLALLYSAASFAQRKCRNKVLIWSDVAVKSAAGFELVVKCVMSYDGHRAYCGDHCQLVNQSINSNLA